MRRRGSEWSVPCRWAIVLLLVLVATPRAWAVPEEATEGRRLYERLCASCHGKTGRGDGPVAPALGERPTDLTVLARDNGGEFSEVDVFMAIDGKAMPRAHGVSEMPIWGEVLRAEPDGDPVTATDTLLLITDFLRTIQRP